VSYDEHDPDPALDRPCPGCGKRESYPVHDRHGFYSGRACDRQACIDRLPGQGAMWNYDPEEPLEEPE
jgi:hypothetical protein